MSETDITSPGQLQTYLETRKLAIVAFYRTSNNAFSTLSSLAAQVGDAISFAKCNVAQNQWAEQEYNITDDPTFLAFKSGSVIQRMSGFGELVTNLRSLAAQAVDAGDASGSGAAASSEEIWLGASTPPNFADVTSAIEKPGVDIMNANTALGGVRELIDATKPSGLDQKAAESNAKKDWVESDTDEQLMVFIPFQTAVKVHSIQITSVRVDDDDEDDDEVPSRPKTIKLYANTAQILGFEEADEREVTQTIELKPSDWDPKTATAVVNTRFVKFQHCSALTMFFVDVEREGAEKVRVDRVRFVGEKLYEKPDMRKLKSGEE